MTSKLLRLIVVAKESGHYDCNDTAWMYETFEREIHKLAVEITRTADPKASVYRMVIASTNEEVELLLEHAAEMYVHERADFSPNMSSVLREEVQARAKASVL